MLSSKGKSCCGCLSAWRTGRYTDWSQEFGISSQREEGTPETIFGFDLW